MTDPSGKLKPPSTPPRWFDELSLGARVVLAMDDFTWEWYGVALSAAAAVALPLSVPSSWALYACCASIAVACAFFVKAVKRSAARRFNDEELRAALWQLGVRSPTRYMRRHPERLRSYWDFGDRIVKAAGGGWEHRRATSAIALLALCVDEPSALDRITVLVAERGLLDPTELLRLVAEGAGCLPLADGAL